MTGRGRIWTAAAAFAFVAAFSPAAFAGTGPSFVVPLMPTAPTIDGSVSFGEWDAATSFQFQLGSHTATGYVGRDATSLYFALQVADPGGPGDSAVYFDNTGNGTVDPGDDIFVFNQAGPPYDWAWVTPNSNNDDTSLGGSQDVVAKAGFAGGVQTFEFQHPLCGADTLHDFCFNGGPLGFDITYRTPATTGSGSGWPGSLLDATTYASLSFPTDATPPSNVGITSPTQTWFKSWPQFTAAASDDVGVASVALQYTDSASVDATTAWTTSVPSMASTGNGTYTATPTVPGTDGLRFWRVVARDAAGNTTASAPIQVGTDNAGPSITASCVTNSGQGAQRSCDTWFAPSDGSIFVRWQIVDSGGIAVQKYTLDGSDPLTSSTASTLPGQGLPTFTQTTTVRFGAIDSLGNQSEKSITVQIDDTAPPPPSVNLSSPSTVPGGHAAASIKVTRSDGSIVYYNPAVAGSFTLAVPQNDDPESGIATATFSPLSSTGWTSTPSPPLSESYTWTASPQLPTTSITVGDTNGAGTASTSSRAVGFQSDSNQPTGGLSCVPTTCSNTSGPVTVTVSASDGGLSGVDTLMYTTNGTTPSATNGTPIAPGGSFDVTQPGTHVAVWGIDNVGNEGLVATNSNISGASSLAPTITSSVPSAASIRLGDSVTDHASVAQGPGGGVASLITGTVAFSVCGPFESAVGCTDGGTPVSSNDLPGDGSAAVDSALFKPSAAGWWCFRADYGGNAQFAPSTDESANECVQVLAANVFVVNTNADHNDESCDATDCTLREAIDAANSFDGSVPPQITFAIPTLTPTIQLLSSLGPLPALTADAVVEGATQPGTLPGAPGVTIDGSALEITGDGLLVSGGSASIFGVRVTGFPNAGIHVTGNGVHVQGSQADHNGQDGILVEHETGALVEDSTAADNRGHGIELFDVLKATAAHNTVERNGIDGLAIDGGAENTLENNTASGNQNQGLSIFTVRAATETNGNLVVENTSTGNGGDGIRVFDGVNNTIGTPSRPNVVHGNTTSSGHGGVAIYSSFFGSSGNTIRGNSIFDNDHDDFSPLGIFVQGGTQIPVPTLKPFVRGGTVFVNGRLTGTPSTTYTIDVYTSGACSPTGFGEGETWKNSVDVTTDVSGAATISFGFDAPATSANVTLTATDDTLHQTGEFSRCATVATGGTATAATLSFDTDTRSTLPGVASVPLSDIPPSAFGSSTSSDGSTQAAPLSAIPLSAIPLSAIPLSAIPLSAIPLSAIGLTPQTLAENGLGGVPLNTIPLKAPLSWEQELQGTPLANLPIQTLTLKDVLALPTPPANLTTPGPNAIGLKDIDLSHSPLSAIPLSAIALGSAPLSAIPISGDGSTTPAQNAADWCAAIQALPEFASYDCTGIGSQTVMGIALQGVPLSAIPLSAIPLSAIPLSAIPLSAIPLSAIDLSSSPLSAIPLSAIDLGATPLSAIPLSAIPLSAIAVCDGTFVCTNKTLGDAVAAGALKPGATLGDLLTYFQAHPEITLAQLVPGLPDSVTFGDLLAALLGGNAPSWEQLPLDGLQAFAGAQNASGGLVTYTAHFTITGTGDTAVAALDVAIPDDAYYVPGSATLNGAALADPVAGASGLTWPLASLSYGTAYTLSFQARPGFRLGDEPAKATLTTNGVGPQSAQADVVVHDTMESNDSPTTSVPSVQPDTLFVSYIGNGKDVDYSTLHVDGTNAPAGSRIKIFLSHLKSDDDLAVFGAGQPPLRSAPLSAIPLSAIPTTDQPVQLGQENQALAPDTAQDIPLPAGKQLLGVSDNRGTADEEIDLTSTGLADDLLIQVSSYDGHPTADPYVLRVEIDSPPSVPPCTQTGPTTTGTTEASMPTITSTTQTLILFDEKRLAQYYSQADAHVVYTKLQAYAARSDVNGAIVPVEADAGVASAYTAWDASMCSPAAANGVVSAIGKLLDTLQAGHPNLKSIVVVGEDNIIPFARLLDETQQANELGFASSFGFVGNEYTGAVDAGYLLSDDPYADPDPQPLFGGSLYVPKLALGRLVETPQQIEQQLDAYQTNNGLANPQTKLVTGYDFLTDGSQAVDGALGRTAPDGSLISETWTADQLRGALLGGTTQPLIDSLNAHYDQHRALSAQGNASHDESAPNLFTTTDLRGQNLAGRIVFTMGCHAGFSLFDGLQYFGPDPNPTDFTFDWAQAYLAGGAIEFMGNTGYGLGDTTAVAYSERLNQLFAQRLDGTMTIGEALEYAKQEYVGDLGVLSLYDAKVGNEATLYGIPTYRLGTGTPPAPPTAPATYTDPATGLTASDFAVNPTYASHTSATLGDYSSANDPNGLGIQVTNRRPIEPLTSLDVTEPGTIAHGILLTGLTSSDTPNVHAAFGRVADDSSAIEPQLTGVVDFPAQIQSIATIATPNGQRQRAVLITGHFASGGSGSVGVQRLYGHLAGTVLYSTSTDFTKPTIRNVQVLQAGSGVAFSADVSDANGVQEVVVLYLDGSGTWQRANLTCAGGHCSGSGPLTGATVDYIVQAADANGNVGINANKAAATNVAPSGGSGHISITITGATATAGWYGGAVTATLASDDGASLSSSLDGAAYVDGPTVPVSGDGLHVLDVRGSDGSSATFSIPVDTQSPVISIFTPADGSYLLAGDTVAAAYSCIDAGIGTASCTGSVPNGSPIDSTAGTKTFTVTAKDLLGHTGTKSSTYQVWPFTGFFSPVNNLPTINSVKSGSAVPVKFSLGGNRGLTFATFGSQKVSCTSGVPVDAIEQTVTAGSSSLQYDSTSNQYTYIWKTDKSFAGQCRMFTMTFTNGDVRKAEFLFK